MDKILSYNITERTANLISGTLQIDRNSEIFQGHFPGNPIVPGACFIDVFLDIIQKYFGVDCYTIEVKNVKFLKLISNLSPDLAFTIQLVSTQEGSKFTAVVSNQNEVALKLAAVA